MTTIRASTEAYNGDLSVAAKPSNVSLRDCGTANEGKLRIVKPTEYSIHHQPRNRLYATISNSRVPRPSSSRRTPVTLLLSLRLGIGGSGCQRGLATSHTSYCDLDIRPV